MTKREPCDCRYWKNQYAAGITLCEGHTRIVTAAAAAAGETPEEFVNAALREALAARR